MRWRLPALIAAGAAVLLAACGPGGAASGAAPERGGGDAAAVRYTDARHHYTLEAPGQLTAQPNGSVSFVGNTERIEISVVQGAATADLIAMAQSDVTGLTTSAPSFHLVAKPAAATIANRHGVKFTYTWNAGASAVTGKPEALTSVRYYIPKDSSTVAVLTYGAATSQFDPQGADDIANTFQWQ